MFSASFESLIFLRDVQPCPAGCFFCFFFFPVFPPDIIREVWGLRFRVVFGARALRLGAFGRWTFWMFSRFSCKVPDMKALAL